MRDVGLRGKHAGRVYDLSIPRRTCCLFFFFSSRRRHTRCGRDWSSDVCSSDLKTFSMSFENGSGLMDKVFDMDGLKVYVDATSLMYLNGCIVDYIETLEGAGFKFENPNVKSTCGCGSSFNV